MSITLCTKGLCRCLRRSLVGVVKNNFPAGGGHFKHGTGFQNRNPVHGTTPTNLNRTLGSDSNIKMYHEVVNSAIMDAVVRPFSGARTPKSCLLTSVARVPRGTHKKWRVNKEMKGWRVRENFTHSSSDGDDDEEESSNECIGRRGPLERRNNAQGVPVVFMLAPQKRKTIQR